MKNFKRLLNISNRLPGNLVNEDGELSLQMSSGGLVSALQGYRDNAARTTVTFEEMVWMGNADFDEADWKEFTKNNPAKAREICPLFIPKEQKDLHYEGMSNSTIWPLFHYFPTYTKFDNDAFEGYQRVNELFADKVVEIYQPGDAIWVHDYQLMLLPKLIRQRLPNATIGFFLHIPFPSFEIFRILPRKWRENLLYGLLGADLIGFHTNDYVLHFQKSIRMILGISSQQRLIQTERREVKSDLFPISIDFDLFNESYDKTEVRKYRRQIGKQMAEVKTIFSVDRLDYSKGLLRRLHGFEKFLDENREWHGKVTYNYVVVPSRDVIAQYSEMKSAIEETIGRINGKFGLMTWQPIVYRYGSLSFDELCAYYTYSDIAFITPVRDGMNLVSKEFVASRKDLRGVLILSEMAGSAAELGEAILVNPNDLDELSYALKRGLTMEPEEQERRLIIMQERIKTYDVVSWADDFMLQLVQIKAHQSLKEVKIINEKTRNFIAQQYRKAKKRLLLLDYDGTLMGFQSKPHLAKPNEKVLGLLKKLTDDPKNTVTVISGRDRDTLGSWLGHLPINLITEHGAARRLNGGEWEITKKDFKQEWQDEIYHQMNLHTRRCAGSFIEKKSHALAWHYRNADTYLGFLRSRELIDSLYRVFNNNMPLQVIDGNKVVEVRITGIDKGTAAMKIYNSDDYDFALAIGDDRTDEDMFKALPPDAITIKVGNENSEAAYNLQNITEVIPFFQQIILEENV